MARASGMPHTVVVAAVGSLGKYLCEEVSRDPRYSLVVLSRQHQKKSWFEENKIDVRVCDYGEDSVLSILNSTNAIALVSFINFENKDYVDIHVGFMRACQKSSTCKKLIPSEWAGNIDDFPLIPQYYGQTREPFRKKLRDSEGIQWTIVNCGWLMDYFLTQDKTYMPPEPDNFPIDPNGWSARIRGTGNETQSWTCARDLAKAVVELLSVSHWEPVTYVVAEWNSFNAAVKLFERLYEKPLDVTYDEQSRPSGSTLSELDEWMLIGASACPREKAMRQRSLFFPNVKLRTLEEVLNQARGVDFI